MEFLSKQFVGTRDEKFAQIVRYLDQNLDDCLQRQEEIKSGSEYIIIDFGNIHDAIAKLRSKLKDFTVIGFADKLYNGPGVNPPEKDITIRRAVQASKNAADVHIIWTVFEIFSQKENAIVHIITKDKGFLELGEIAKYTSHTVKFYNSTDVFISTKWP